jgi:Domain of unknown function (DUF4276)
LTHLYLGVEDRLSEAVGNALISHVFGEAASFTLMMKEGAGYLRSRVSNFCQLARRDLVLVITDLDHLDCAPTLLGRWLAETPKPTSFLLRVAVREIESWLMADSQSMADFLGIPQARVPRDVEHVADPKRTLLELARRASKEIRSDLLPSRNSAAKQGLGYNDRLTYFTNERWDIQRARDNSDSLNRAITRLEEAAANVQ